MTDFYTLLEYAERIGKDPGNLRRMLIKGQIHGEKLGKQWIIPKDTELPPDGRIKSGKYKNWRKRATVNEKAPHLISKLTEMSEALSSVYGDLLESVILYGSYARGDQTPDSDVDIAVILKDGNTEKMHDAMVDVVVNCELDMAVTLSVVPIEYDNYLTRSRVLPFYMNIEKEGIVLWKQT